MNIQRAANHVTIQNLINCYIRETGKGQFIHREVLPIEQQSHIKTALLYKVTLANTILMFPVTYRSMTGRHLFGPSCFYQCENHFYPLDYLTLLSLLKEELQDRGMDELYLRVILSYQNIYTFLTKRSSHLEIYYKRNKTFIEAEQSLLIGHQMHPTPKSRQGISLEEEEVFAPELQGRFALHYFYIHQQYIEERSAYSQSAVQLIKKEVRFDPEVSESFKEAYCQEDDYALIPMHPLQARHLLGQKEVTDLIHSGVLTYLGEVGTRYAATSSVRTVYREDAKYMYKFSIPVKITNSVRVNKRKELERGVEVSQLLQSELGDDLKRMYPSFSVINDPAYINIPLGNGESGFEVMIRENPFRNGYEHDVFLIAGLCQDHIEGKKATLTKIIEHIASQECISAQKASKKWFVAYLQHFLYPLVWLYTKYGIALEAHQQNSVVKLNDQGYPRFVYYRDNQGYYFMESKAESLQGLLPSLNKHSDTICQDDVAKERFIYYVFFNHLYGLINAFGTQGLCGEEELLTILKQDCQTLMLWEDHTELMKTILTSSSLACKANLLTRVHDMDELVGDMATQSVYVKTNNPIGEGERKHATTS
ncbi:IucA/IucC family protein [Priestia koreensis]|uniref:IucA/IucC family protein n=1 Tax=Priestia koreensis TaxID=284581 RepID=UPI00203AE9B3|nr:IucA/IucC family protein [Priestia koreensis]MCM3004300.1 IucA/IucC family siderophore biosynthesis protein [Priestia koreensis]